MIDRPQSAGDVLNALAKDLFPDRTLWPHLHRLHVQLADLIEHEMPELCTELREAHLRGLPRNSVEFIVRTTSTGAETTRSAALFYVAWLWEGHSNAP